MSDTQTEQDYLAKELEEDLKDLDNEQLKDIIFQYAGIERRQK